LPEKSDASGLLAGDVATWESADLPGLGAPDAPTGTLPGEPAAGVYSPPGFTVPPIAPIIGIAPVVGPHRSEPDKEERSNASQLLESESAFGAPVGATEPGLPAGTAQAVDGSLPPLPPPPPTQLVDHDGHHRDGANVIPPIFPWARGSGTIAERDQPERPRSAEYLEESSPWVPGGPAGSPEETPGEAPDENGESMPNTLDDRVPVVRSDGSDDDFDSWNNETLPWGGDEGTVDDDDVDDDPPGLPRGGPNDGADEDPAAWGSLGWQDERIDDTAGPDADVPVSPAYTAWRPSRIDPEAEAAARIRERPLNCGGPDLSEEELAQVLAEREAADRERRARHQRLLGRPVEGDEEEEEEDDDQKKSDERQALKLLRQDGGAWGGNVADSGVIG
jgi:hypothetical protein